MFRGHHLDTDVTQISPDQWKTSFHAVAEAGHLDIVQSLLEVGADVNKRDEDHQTPLYHASVGGKVEVAKLPIEHGADVNSPDTLTLFTRYSTTALT